MAKGAEHASSVKSVAFSPCRKFFVTGCTDGSIIIWDVPQVKSNPFMHIFSHSLTIFCALKEYWGKDTPPPYELGEIKPTKSEPKTGNSARSGPQKENIDGLVANTPKNNVNCIECPPVQPKKKPEENCNFVAEVRKC